MEQISGLGETNELQGVSDCERCFLHEDVVVKNCPVMREVILTRKSDGEASVYSEMALRLLARATEHPVKDIDMMDELFDGNSREIKRTTLDLRLDNAVSMLKGAFGGDVIQVKTEDNTKFIQVDGDVVQIWCQKNRSIKSQPTQEEVVKLNKAQVEKYRLVTDLPGLTQMVFNYIFRIDTQPELDENELFEDMSTMIRDAMKEIDNKTLVINCVDKAKKAALSDAMIRKYAQHPEASKRFRRLANMIQMYRPHEDF